MPFPIFLDSGAFSVHRSGKTIDIQDYIAFIKKHKPALYANLDVIGDDPKASQTKRNQAVMEKAGLKPLPCFHVGEDFSVLDEYLTRYKYIALGGMVGRPKKDLLVWITRCFESICDKDGLPKVKVHGFGMTSFSFMRMFPWYSIDSTSWIMDAAMNHVIYMPQIRKGVEVFDLRPNNISMSKEFHASKESITHYTHLSKMEQGAIEKWAASCGYSVEDLHTNATFRSELNAMFLIKFISTVPPWPWKWDGVAKKRKGLLL